MHQAEHNLFDFSLWINNFASLNFFFHLNRYMLLQITYIIIKYNRVTSESSIKKLLFCFSISSFIFNNKIKFIPKEIHLDAYKKNNNMIILEILYGLNLSLFIQTQNILDCSNYSYTISYFVFSILHYQKKILFNF